MGSGLYNSPYLYWTIYSNPVASANANPKIAYENNWPLSEGFLATPNIKAPNTTPIPIPAPIKPAVAIIYKEKNFFFYFS